MDRFEYLIALVSVVAGLAITHTLSSIARIVNARQTISISWIPLSYCASLLLWLIAFWWFTFQYSGDVNWTPWLHIFVLIYAGLIYFLLALLIPENIEEHHDMLVHFIKNRKLFFGSFLFLPLVDIIDSWIKLGIGDQYIFNPVYWIHMLSWIIIGFTGIMNTKPKLHAGLSIVFLFEVIIWLSTSITGAFYFSK